MIKGSIAKIETFGLLDGPGIRTVIFLNGCKLRCKYCHNPEMQQKQKDNMSVEELVDKILRNKPYFKNGGGVTFSGGEPLLQAPFLIEVMKKLKKEDINICLDTAGVGLGNYEEILKYVDLILFDVKHTDDLEYFNLTGSNPTESLNFLKVANKLNKNFWIRQVIIPGINENEKYLESLTNYLHKNIKNILKIEFLPFHTLGFSKYEEFNINNKFKDIPAMDKEKCEDLYNKFIDMYNK